MVAWTCCSQPGAWGHAAHAIGVDMTPAMRESAVIAAREAGLDGVGMLVPGRTRNSPVADASVDVVISNGVINLAPDKTRVFREIERVLKPGGRRCPGGRGGGA